MEPFDAEKAAKQLICRIACPLSWHNSECSDEDRSECLAHDKGNVVFVLTAAYERGRADQRKVDMEIAGTYAAVIGPLTMERIEHGNNIRAAIEETGAAAIESSATETEKSGQQGGTKKGGV